MKKLRIFIKIIFQIKFYELLNIAFYKIGLILNLFSIPLRKIKKIPNLDDSFFADTNLLNWHQEIDENFLFVADQILEGNYPLFGVASQKLDLDHHSALVNWQEYERGNVKPAVDDIKMIWEPARFGWAVVLSAAYSKTGNKKYLTHFIVLLDNFFQNNPKYLGPNWTSGQEAAIRIICVSYCLQFFLKSPFLSAENKSKLTHFLYENARRIPPTLSYARAQNNNHLLLEGIGLITAGSIFMDSNETRKWGRIGWKIFYRCVKHQFNENGEYVQHSTNYHRMALQAIYWALGVAEISTHNIPQESLIKISLAQKWLHDRVDPISGKTPNYGHNDGSYLIPLSVDYTDYLPVLKIIESFHLPSINTNRLKTILRVDDTWVRMQGISIHSRPAHADQLHVDLWHNGKAITLDPGTFSYNLAFPWDNRLASTRVHNTIQIEDLDQMSRVSKFLWLDWAQAKWQNSDGLNKVIACHNGYRKLGLLHTRTLTLHNSKQITIVDSINPISMSHREIPLTLQWLLREQPWKILDDKIIFDFKEFSVSLNVIVNSSISPEFSIIRAGETIYGSSRPEPYMGWYSQTYLAKVPALSLNWTINCIPPILFTSTFTID